MVANGRFNSRSEVLREGVRIVHEREPRLLEVGAFLQKGIDSIDAGRVLSSSEVFGALREQQKKILEISIDRDLSASRADRSIDLDDGFNFIMKEAGLD